MNYGLIVLLLASLAACQTADEKVIGIGQGIRHDDFVYTVRHVDTAGSSSPMKPNGRLWIVNFEVKNQATRTAHAWTNKTAYITDAAGHVYENQSHEQRLTPAGHTEHVLLLFDLPRTLTKPYLQVRGETFMGDIVDGRQFEKTKIRLF